MKFVPKAVSLKIGRQILVSQKNSPTILFVGGVVGVVATTVLACRATLKLEDILEDSKKKLELSHTYKDDISIEYAEQDRRKDVALIYVKNVGSIVRIYGPSIAIGTLSIAALTGSHRILTNRNAALTVALTTLQTGFDEYRRRVVDELGPEKDQEFRYGTEVRKIKNEETGKLETITKAAIDGASVHARYFDSKCASWKSVYDYNLFFLESQQQYANDLLLRRGHVTLNDVYDSLGMERSVDGFLIGWLYRDDGDNVIDFGYELNSSNLPSAEEYRNFRTRWDGAILLDFNVDPGTIYDKI
jgi:Family of unknown function (DUF6353)